MHFYAKKNKQIELTTVLYMFTKSGKYKMMVKFVDVAGVDTSHVVELGKKM